MSVSVTFNGTTYTLPTSGEVDWGAALTSFLQSVASNAATKASVQTLTNKTLGSGTVIPAGTGSGTATLTGVLHTNTTSVGNVGTGEDDLMTYSLPANSVVTNGRGIRIKAWGSTAANSNAKRVKIHFGAVVLEGVSLIAGGAAGKWSATATIVRSGSSAQRYSSDFLENRGGSVTLNTDCGTLTQTETGAITIKCTGTATADNDIVQEGMIVEYI